MEELERLDTTETSDYESGGTKYTQEERINKTKTIPMQKTRKPPQQEPPEANTYIYIGPTLLNGALKQNAVFHGSKKAIEGHLTDVIDNYPQVSKLIVPISKLADAKKRIAINGNIFNEVYNSLLGGL